MRTRTDVRTPGKSRLRPNCQTISEKTGAFNLNGRFWIGTAERLWARHSGIMLVARRMSAAQDGLPSAGLVGLLAMDARR
jgi:hypothetical protein